MREFLGEEFQRVYTLLKQQEMDEFDRQVMDRMLGPFEHLLRNAIVHGIGESQDVLPSEAVALKYADDKTDEFLLPMVFGEDFVRCQAFFQLC